MMIRSGQSDLAKSGSAGPPVHLHPAAGGQRCGVTVRTAAQTPRAEAQAGARAPVSLHSGKMHPA
jgi:hypothetical protein